MDMTRFSEETLRANFNRIVRIPMDVRTKQEADDIAGAAAELRRRKAKREAIAKLARSCKEHPVSDRTLNARPIPLH